MSNDKDKPTTTQAPPNPAKADREPPAFVKSRDAANRNMSMRDAEIREQLMMSYSDPLHIPKEMIPEDLDLHWGRDTYRNELDPGRLMTLEQRGWTVAQADKYPKLVRQRQDDRDRHWNGYIHFKGLILMERPKRWGEIEREMEAQACYDSLVGLPGMNNMNQKGFTDVNVHAKAFMNQTATSKTARFKE